MTEQPMSLIEQLENPPRGEGGRLNEDETIDLMRTAAFALSTMIGVAAAAPQPPSLITGAAQTAPDISSFLNAVYDAIGDLETDKDGNVRWSALVNIQRGIGQKAHDLAAQPPAAPVSPERRCQKCGETTKGEEALVDGQIWCHPCADAHPRLSAATEGETKTVYVKRWRTLVKLPAKYADEIVAALRIPVEPQEVPHYRQALENAREEIVLAIAFLGRDIATKRLDITATQLCARLVNADAAIRTALSLSRPVSR